MKKKLRYSNPKTIVDGEWVHPVRRGHLMYCCDCGLCHRIEFTHEAYGNGRTILFRAFREDELTRKHRNKRGLKHP